jgi:hypothetical protein
MGKVTRLKDDVTTMLQTYSPDPNEAIRAMNSTILLQKSEILALKNTNPATNSQPIRILPGDSSSDCGINLGEPSESYLRLLEKSRLQMAKEKFSETPVPESGVPAIFNDSYWKKLGETVQKSVESMVGH